MIIIDPVSEQGLVLQTMRTMRLLALGEACERRRMSCGCWSAFGMGEDLDRVHDALFPGRFVQMLCIINPHDAIRLSKSAGVRECLKELHWACSDLRASHNSVWGLPDFYGHRHTGLLVMTATKGNPVGYAKASGTAILLPTAEYRRFMKIDPCDYDPAPPAPMYLIENIFR